MYYGRFPKYVTRRIKSALSARHWLYLACHAILALTGLILMLLDPQSMKVAKFFAAVGGSLVAMGVGGAVLFLMVWIDRKEAQRLNDMREYGLSRIFPARSVSIRSEYDERLAHASDSIDIMGFGLQHLREDYGEVFAKWTDQATVRILIVDPEFPSKESPIADLRDVEERHLRGDIRNDVMGLICSCRNLIKDDNSNFKVRLYRCLPSINLFRIDQDIFWGPYLIGDVSRNMPTFLMEADGRLSKKLIEHFDRIWSNEAFSREIPNEWL